MASTTTPQAATPPGTDVAAPMSHRLTMTATTPIWGKLADLFSQKILGGVG